MRTVVGPEDIVMIGSLRPGVVIFRYAKIHRSSATAPMPWLIVTVVAFVVDQDSVADCPCVIDTGDALIVAVGGAGMTTVMVAVDVAHPSSLVAVSV